MGPTIHEDVSDLKVRQRTRADESPTGSISARCGWLSLMALGCTAIRTSGHVQRDLPRELEGAAALRAAGRAAGPQVAWRPRLAGAARDLRECLDGV